MFEFIDQEAPECNVDVEFVDSIEQRLGIRFPTVLKEYYLQHNGAEIYESPFICNGSRFCVIEMLTMKYGTLPVDVLCIHQAEADEIPAGYIPFALDEDYDYFYWHKDTGRVVFISREDAENPMPVCDSMDEFFSILNEVNRKDGGNG